MRNFYSLVLKHLITVNLQRVYVTEDSRMVLDYRDGTAICEITVDLKLNITYRGETYSVELYNSQDLQNLVRVLDLGTLILHRKGDFVFDFVNATMVTTDYTIELQSRSLSTGKRDTVQTDITVDGVKMIEVTNEEVLLIKGDEVKRSDSFSIEGGTKVMQFLGLVGDIDIAQEVSKHFLSYVVSGIIGKFDTFQLTSNSRTFDLKMENAKQTCTITLRCGVTIYDMYLYIVLREQDKYIELGIEPSIKHKLDSIWQVWNKIGKEQSLLDRALHTVLIENLGTLSMMTLTEYSIITEQRGGKREYGVVVNEGKYYVENDKKCLYELVNVV